MIGVDGHTIKNEDEDDPYGISSTKHGKNAQNQRDEEEMEDVEEDEAENDFIDLQDEEPMDEEETDNYYQPPPPQKENNQNKFRQTVAVVQSMLI